jgi:hypothetical protein
METEGGFGAWTLLEWSLILLLVGRQRQRVMSCGGRHDNDFVWISI